MAQHQKSRNNNCVFLLWILTSNLYVCVRVFLDHGEIYEHNYITFFQFGMLHPFRLPFMGRPMGGAARSHHQIGIRTSWAQAQPREVDWLMADFDFFPQEIHDPKIKTNQGNCVLQICITIY